MTETNGSCTLPSHSTLMPYELDSAQKSVPGPSNKDYLVQHVLMDVIQPLQLLAFGGHESAPIMCRGAV